MSEAEHLQPIPALRTVIDEVYRILVHFKIAGIDERRLEAYEALLGIYDESMKQCRTHTRAILEVVKLKIIPALPIGL